MDIHADLAAHPKRHCIFILFSSGLSGEVGYDEDRGLGRGRAGTDGSPERASAILVTGLAGGRKT